MPDDYITLWIKTLADLIDPKLEPQIETLEGLFLERSHGILSI